MTKIKMVRRELSIILIILLLTIATLVHFYSLREKRNFTEKIFFYKQTLEIMYKRQSHNLPAGAVIFFGDSQIQGLSVIAISHKSVNFGIGHQQLTDLAFHMREYSGLEHAEKIVIGIGINDLLKAKDLNKGIYIEELIQTLKGFNSKVFLLSVLPVNEHKLNKPNLNRYIQIFNQQLMLASQKYGFKYIDLYSYFTDGNGLLKKNYDIGDGLHLNQVGYEVLIQRLKLEFNAGKAYES